MLLPCMVTRIKIFAASTRRACCAAGTLVRVVHFGQAHVFGEAALFCAICRCACSNCSGDMEPLPRPMGPSFMLAAASPERHTRHAAFGPKNSRGVELRLTLAGDSVAHCAEQTDAHSGARRCVCLHKDKRQARQAPSEPPAHSRSREHSELRALCRPDTGVAAGRPRARGRMHVLALAQEDGADTGR